MISVIIPFFNRFDLIMRRMFEIHQYFHFGTNQIYEKGHPRVFLPEDIEILMMNNGSDPSKIDEGSVYYWQKMVNWFPVRYLKWKENIGFGGAMNRGAGEAKGDILVFLSDDVRISGDFLHTVREIIEKDPTALVCGEMVWWPGGWNEFDIQGKKVVVPYANGWLLACTKRTWVESGGFDPLYFPIDYEDLDLSTRWHEMGYNIVALNSPFVQHIGGATASQAHPDRVKITEQHRQLYIMKWCDKLLDINMKYGG